MPQVLVTYDLYWFCTWHLFVSLLWQVEKMMYLVLSQPTLLKIHLTQLEKHVSFLSYTWFTYDKFRYLWMRLYPVSCSVYTVFSLLPKAFRVYRIDAEFSTYFGSFRFCNSILLLTVHIQVVTIQPGIPLVMFSAS